MARSPQTRVRRVNRQPVPLAAGLALAAMALTVTTARADRRPPYGMDAILLEAQVRETIERRITPLLEQMAPGQAELKYVDVRVNRPTALPAGASPGFEEMAPGAEFVAEKAEVSLVLDSKLPPPFRKDLKNLIKNRLEGLAVPIEIRESVIAFPTPRPQPTTPPEMPFRYPPMPQMQQPQPPQAPQAPSLPPTPPAQPETAFRGFPTWLAIVLGVLAGVLIAALVAALVALRRRSAHADARQGRGDGTDASGKTTPTAAAAAADHLPEVRRALREDRVLARRVMGELLRENQVDKVAVAVELVGPTVVEDLRGDPTCAIPLREAAALLVEARPRTDTKEIVTQLHRRILKHRMVGAEDPVAQEFAFLLGLSPERLAGVLAAEPPAVQAAALRYAPGHVRSAYIAERSPAERSALAAALAAPKSLSKEHLLDVASTLRARAADQAHLDAGETGDIDLAVELIEERAPAEQAEMLEAMRRGDPAKARAVQAALISDQSFERVSDDVLTAAAMAVPTEVLGRFLRDVPETIAGRALSALPRTVAASIQEDLSLDVAATPQQISDARRTMFAALRKALRDRGLAAPSLSIQSGSDKGKVVAI
jgi:flagellar motor switch protein FliG